jgi:hypothetical protein
MVGGRLAFCQSLAPQLYSSFARVFTPALAFRSARWEGGLDWMQSGMVRSGMIALFIRIRAGRHILERTVCRCRAVKKRRSFVTAQRLRPVASYLVALSGFPVYPP